MLGRRVGGAVSICLAASLKFHLWKCRRANLWDLSRTACGFGVSPWNSSHVVPWWIVLMRKHLSLMCDGNQRADDDRSWDSVQKDATMLTWRFCRWSRPLSPLAFLLVTLYYLPFPDNRLSSCYGLITHLMWVISRAARYIWPCTWRDAISSCYVHPLSLRTWAIMASHINLKANSPSFSNILFCILLFFCMLLNIIRKKMICTISTYLAFLAVFRSSN